MGKHDDEIMAEFDPLTMTGCYIEGHRGWHGTAMVLDVANSFGVPITTRDRRLMYAYDRGWTIGCLQEVAHDMADEYIAKLNDRLPEDIYAGWHDCEFFIMPAYWWEGIY